MQGAQEVPEAAATAKKPRVDGAGMRRESPFSLEKDGGWLSEADVDFFTGGAPLALSTVVPVQV